MGTHGALAITLENGEHFCVERTMDGYNVEEYFRSILRGDEFPKTIDPGVIGNGGIEAGIQREHDQSHFVHINHKDKVVTASGSPPLNEETLEVIGRWLKKGWKFDNGYDCCEPGKEKSLAICESCYIPTKVEELSGVMRKVKDGINRYMEIHEKCFVEETDTKPTTENP